MKKQIKKILPNWLISFIKLKRKKRAIKNKHIKDTFTYINESKHWTSDESVSGDGSELEVTQELRNKLEVLLSKKNIKSMLDIPSGDFNWMRKVNLNGINYVGGDIVENLIKTNNERYKKDTTNFEVLDLTSSKLPKVDLIFCRDCLVHLSYKDIYKALQNIKKSESTYLLTTSFYRCEENNDIITGEWRRLNFTIFPFFFKEPLDVLDENYTKKGFKYSDKTMCLWDIRDISIPFRLKLYYWFT